MAVDMGWQLGVLLVFAVVRRPALGEILDEPCFELGKQWVYEAKELLLCDRSGRRVNINKFCKSHLSGATGRLIIDNSKEEQSSTEPRKQAGHFPELCLPGQRQYTLQSPWLCTCTVHKPGARWECVAPEGGGGSAAVAHNLNSDDHEKSSNRVRRSASSSNAPPASSSQQQPPSPLQPPPPLQHQHVSSPASPTFVTLEADVSELRNGTGLSATSSTGLQSHSHSHGRVPTAAPSTTPWPSSPEPHEEHGHDAGRNSTGILGRQAAPTRQNIIIDFCDEFGYIHSVTSSGMRECACDKDVISTKMLGYKENDVYHTTGTGIFSAYECLPGVYSVRCEVCYPDMRTCQPTACL